jgi:opacity protein-like surface antigen
LFAAIALYGASAPAQTSIGVSLYGAFSGTTTGNGVQESPSNSAGGLVELRHISNPIFGYEATYSYNRANQVYKPACSGTVCSTLAPALVSANAHQVTADWIPSIHLANLRPFGVLGIGVLMNQPTGSQTNTTTSTKAVYVYGAGLDWGLLPHLGLRFQYRGNLYKSPDLSKLYTSTNTFRHTAEPMLGAYVSF